MSMEGDATKSDAVWLEDFRRVSFRAAVSYQEFSVRSELADLVACTWQRRVPARGAAATQRVVPDGCVDLVWRGSQLWVVGPDTGPVMSPLDPGETVVGLRFRPGAAGAALGLPASELRDGRVPLADVWAARGAELAERLGDADTPRARRALLENTVTGRRAGMDDLDPIVLMACRRLGLRGSRVRSISAGLAMSERQLLRRFRNAVGYGPKTLDRVLRFQRFLSRARAADGGEVSLAALAAELGYADQAHLTRECVRLSGLTPTALAAARSAPASAAVR
jgi:AraC-like DNA-binding protein